MIKNFSDTKLKNLVKDICNEHWQVANPSDSNIAYLWYMYAAGNKVGTFRPFIFLAEVNLLFKTGYITEVEKTNMLQMLNSSDEDNANILAYSILTFRTNRIKDMGVWTSDNDKYNEINYIKDIIDKTIFINNKL